MEQLTKEWYAARREVEPDYIGDGVYASWDGFHVWLRTPREDSLHEIALDQSTFAALLRYVERIKGATNAK